MNLLAMLGIDQNNLLKDMLDNPEIKTLVDNFNKFLAIQEEQLQVLKNIETILESNNGNAV